MAKRSELLSVARMEYEPNFAVLFVLEAIILLLPMACAGYIIDWFW